MPANPTYKVFLELAVGSLTDISSQVLRASWSRSIADSFFPLFPEPALLELDNNVGSFSPILNPNVTVGRRVSIEAQHNFVALDSSSLDNNNAYSPSSWTLHASQLQVLTYFRTVSGDNWAAQVTLNAQRSSSSRFCWHQLLTAAGVPRFDWSDDGSAPATGNLIMSGTAPNSIFGSLLASCRPFALLTSVNLNDGAGNRTASWEVSTDFNLKTLQGNFSLLTSVSTTGVSSFSNIAGADLELTASSSGATEQFMAKVYYCHVTNGTSGALLVDFHPTRDATPGQKYFRSSATGKDWFITSGYNLISDPSSTYPQFFGRVRSAITDPVLSERKTVLEAMTEAELLSRTLLRTPVFVGIQVNSLVSEVLTRTSIRSFSSSGLYDQVAFAGYEDQSALDSINKILESGFYEAALDGAGTLKFRNRYGGGLLPSEVRSYSEEFQDLKHSYNIDKLANYFQVSAVPRRQETSVATVAYLPRAIPIAPLGRVNFAVTYRDPRNAVGGTAVGSIISPVASQDWYISANSDGTGTDYTSQVSLSFTGFAVSGVASLYSSLSSFSVYISRFQVRGYPILAGAELSVVAEDADSQSSYGRAERKISDSLVADFDAMLDFASSVVEQDSSPQNVLTAVMVNEFPDVLALDVGNPVAIVNSLTGINSYWAIRRAQHDVSLIHGLEHRVSYELEEFRAPLLRECEAVNVSSGGVFRSNSLTGVSSGALKGTFSAFFKQTNVNTGYRGLLTIHSNDGDDDPRVHVQLRAAPNSGNVVSPHAAAKTAVLSYSFSVAGQPVADAFPNSVDGRWHNLMISWDLSTTAPRVRFYIDDRKWTGGTIMRAGHLINYVSSLNEVGRPYTTGGGGGTTNPAYDMAEVYFNSDEFIDFDVMANRRRFLSSGLKPVDLGADGSRPTGAQPTIYLSLDRGYSDIRSFAANRGTGGNFSIVNSNAVSVASVSPSD